MKQEYKELLLKDLCARLPYGVKLKLYNGELDNDVLDSIDIEEYIIINGKDDIENVKPYLSPLSSMTEEQKKEYHSIIYRSIELHYNEYCDVIDIDFFDVLQDFYLKNHFDYRGLIPIGLALDATELDIY